MDVLLPIFQLLYFSVHFIYSLAQAVVDCFYELYYISSKFIWRSKKFTPSAKQLLLDASRLKKLPRHLGFIFAPKQANNYKHICHVINWSLGLGIHCISLYDVDGILKSKLPSLLDDLLNVCSDVTFKVNVDGQVYVRECATSPSSSNTSYNTSKSPCTLNGIQKHTENSKTTHPHKLISRLERQPLASTKHSQVIMLNVLCVEDGKEDIIRIAKNIFEKKTMLDLDNIHKDLITKDQVDPDLAIVLGRPTCTLGFLPWQIRLTEFLNVPSVTRLDYVEFKTLLQIYSKCEQRFGS